MCVGNNYCRHKLTVAPDDHLVGEKKMALNFYSKLLRNIVVLTVMLLSWLEAAAAVEVTTILAPGNMDEARTSYLKIGEHAYSYNLKSSADEPIEGFSFKSTVTKTDHIKTGDGNLIGSKDTVDFQECSCEENECSCPVGYGVMINRLNSSSVFTFEADDTFSVMTWVDKNETSTLSEACFFIIGSYEIKNENDLRDLTTFYITTTDSVIITMMSDECDIEVWYAAIRPEFNTTTISHTSGTIAFPDDAQVLIEGWGYPPQKRLEYVFSYPENYAVEFSIAKQDLGSRSTYLHDFSLSNCTQNDFLLIGLGDEILAGTDMLLYGRAATNLTIRVNYHKAHVVFYGDYHEQLATGFSINYKAIRDTLVVLPTPPPSTAPPPISLPLPTTWAAIDSAQASYSTTSSLEDAFTATLSSVATAYIQRIGLPVTPPPSVSATDVHVYAITTCSGHVCSSTCAAFNFSISKLDATGDNWAFTTSVLDDMIRDPALQEQWEQMCSDCEPCEETVDHESWGAIGGVVAFLLVVTALLAAAAWVFTAKNNKNKAHHQYMETLKQEKADRRRRSSGDVSVIGAPMKTHRRSLPFRSRSSTCSSQLTVEHYDIAGFTDFDLYDDFEEITNTYDGSFVNLSYDHDQHQTEWVKQLDALPLAQAPTQAASIQNQNLASETLEESKL
ncbi:uncharacterized protein LOC108672879 [Hyalella azteca]|uniref:Uncharacterized protein LOC108672879 n=1 Tax=Hyalella azteca TaxID=294128 RepID=A0A8B7NSW7_HYAAZ|nr:uncharacterized protein LOC108672879 [Hyalella azteca]